MGGADIRKARGARSGRAVRLVAPLSAHQSRDTVAKALRVAGARREAVSGVCGLAGLGGLETVRVRDLTAGQRARLAIAAALVAGPDLVVADSPLDGVPSDERAAILKDLSDILGETRAVVVWIADAADEALALDARAVVLVEGRIAQEGPAKEVGDHPATFDVARLFWGTALNILPLAVESDGCRLPDGSTLVLPGCIMLPACGMAKLAVRADDLRFDRKDASALRFVVRVLGGDAPAGYAAVDFSGLRWLAPVADGLPAPGMLASVYVPSERVLVFGADGTAMTGA